jgi:integrase
MTRRPRGTGHAYLRGRVWWIAYHVRGRLVRESAGTEIKNEAERLLRARVMAADAGIAAGPEAQRATLHDLATLVATDYQNNGLRSLRQVVGAFDRLAEFFGGRDFTRTITRGRLETLRREGRSFLARRITVDQIESYKRARLEGGAAAATINRELAALKRGFRLATRVGRLVARPDFSLLREHNVRRGFFEAEQFEAVVSELPKPLQAVATFLYWTGWRKQEALTLEWRHVDRRAGVIRIEETKNREARTIPYARLPALATLIGDQWETVQTLRREQGTVVPWVFHRNGERILDFLGAWHGACRRAGLPGRIPHDFRRTAARNMIRAGISQPVAMAIGGWKTDSVFRRYAIVDETLIGEGLGKLASLAKPALGAG